MFHAGPLPGTLRSAARANAARSLLRAARRRAPPTSVATTASTCVGEHPSVLARVLEPGVTVVVWRRALATPLVSYCDLEARGHVHGHQRLLEGPRPGVRRLAQGCALRAERATLEADIEQLLAHFRELLPADPQVPVLGGLDVLDRDGCRKLHVDYVHLRLLCTYAGPGTEWVDDADVNRAALGPNELDAATANAQVASPGSIRRARVGDVVVLKGRGWPGAAGAVHRSPPIEASGERRLLLTLTWAGSAAQTAALRNV